MTGLSPEQIANLTRKADQAESAKQNKSRWLLPEDAKLVLKKMDSKATTVAIGGELFIIVYDSPDKVFLKPERHGKFVPCGWYTRQLLESLAA